MKLLFDARLPIGTFMQATQADMNRSTIPLPAEAPVMVLPGAVLFPGSILPLRIFEPRYRAMLQWALEHDRMFCIALMKEGIAEAETEDQFFHTAGIGLVSASVTLADGTSNLMLQGLSRVRFTGFPQRAPFRIANIAPVPDITGSPAKTAALAAALRKQCAAIRVNGAPLPEALAKIFTQATDPDDLADAVANALLSDPMQRQHILGEPDLASRLRELARILGEDFHD